MATVAAVENEENVVKESPPWLPHGTIVGIASTGVIGYNCNYQHIEDVETYDPISYVRDSRGKLHVAGNKWQCVEYARRWWLSQLGVKLPGVPRACDIFTSLTKIKSFTHHHEHHDGNESDSKKIKTTSYVALRKYNQNESTIRPEVHDAIIWINTEKAPVGHIAIVSEVTDTYIRIAEQNVDNDIMWKGGTFAREFPLERNSETGAWFIRDDEDPIYGWVRVDIDSDEPPPIWIPPTTNQLEVNGIYDEETSEALCRFVGSVTASNFPAEEREKWLPLCQRLVDYSLGGFLNTHLPESYPFVALEWKGWSPEPHNREPLIRKFQIFLNLYPEITGVGKDLIVEVNGLWDEPTIRAIQMMLNKVHTTVEFDSALEHYRPDEE